MAALPTEVAVRSWRPPPSLERPRLGSFRALCSSGTMSPAVAQAFKSATVHVDAPLMDSRKGNSMNERRDLPVEKPGGESNHPRPAPGDTERDSSRPAIDLITAKTEKTAPRASARGEPSSESDESEGAAPSGPMPSIFHLRRLSKKTRSSLASIASSKRSAKGGWARSGWCTTRSSTADRRSS